jgi:hypothetical protein
MPLSINGHQTFWPDCRTLDTTNDNPPIQCSICLDPFRSNLNVHTKGVVPINNINNIQKIINSLS